MITKVEEKILEALLTDELIENTYLYCWKRMANKDEARDVAQEIVVDAMIILRSGKKIENFYGLYWRIASNKVNDFYRSKKNSAINLDDMENLLLGFDKTLGDYIRQEELDNLSKTMNNLAAIHRDILVRFYIKEQSVKEISSALSIPLGTVTKRLSDARKKFKEDYENMENQNKNHTEDEKLKVHDLEMDYFGQNYNEWMAIGSLLDKQILFLCRETPKSVDVLAKEIDAAPAFIEASVEKLKRADILFEPEGKKGKLLTDFAILPKSVIRQAVKDEKLFAEKMNFQKRYLEILNEMKEEILAEDFYGNDLPWEYLLPYFIIRSDREFKNNLVGDYLREKYFKGFSDRKWRYGFQRGLYEDEENPEAVEKNTVGPGYNYNQLNSVKYGRFEVHPVIQSMNFTKDGKTYELTDERLTWINGINFEIYRKIVEKPEEKLSPAEEEILADFISKGIIEKTGTDKKTYKGTIPLIPFALVEKWCKIWKEKFKPLAEEYTEAIYQSQKNTVLKYIRKDLQWAASWHFFPENNLDSLLIDYAVENNLVQFEEGTNASLASVVILVE